MSVERRFALLRHDHGLDSIEAFSLTGLAEDDILEYNAVTTKWENSADAAQIVALRALLADAATAADSDARIGVKKVLTNSVATTQHAVNEGRWVNVVVDYDVDDTGASNASTGINNAITDATAGDTIYIPGGIFLINTTIALKAGVRMVMEGRSCSLNAGNNSMSIFSRTGTATTEFFYEIHGGYFNANGKSSVIGIDLAGNSTTDRLSDIVIEKSFFSTLATAVELQNCANVNAQQLRMSACTEGWRQDDCADVDLAGIAVHNGGSWGFYFTGTTGATAYDEGLRMSNCSTNGQDYAIRCDDMDWMQFVNCSFSTSDTQCGDFNNCTNVSMSNVDWAPADTGVVGLNLDSSCENFTITGGHAILCSFGFIISGENHTITGVSMHNNGNVDLYVSGALNCAFSTCQLASTAAAWSFIEVASANYNAFTGIVSDKLQTPTGANSIATGGIVY